MMRVQTLKAYYYLTKPGIIRGNLITATAGFLLASAGQIHVVTGLSMLVGLGLIIAAACVYNNYLDRAIDVKMARTARRSLVTGKISGRAALIFATSLLVFGWLILALRTNVLTVVLALTGLIAYVAVYGFYKRRSTLGTAVGSISGAIPPVVGYAAASGQIDGAAIILFVILVCWQMPHFFAIAMYRLKDYAAAEIPVLPVEKGLAVTKLQCLLYIAAYGVASSALTVFGYTGKIYLLVMICISLYWFYIATKGFKTTSTDRWAKQLFLFSLVAITVQCVLISVDTWLP